MDDIYGFEKNEGADGNSVMIEISTKYYYRLYGCSEPSVYKDKYYQANNIIQIINLLEKEFNFKPLDRF